MTINVSRNENFHIYVFHCRLFEFSRVPYGIYIAKEGSDSLTVAINCAIVFTWLSEQSCSSSGAVEFSNIGKHSCVLFR